MKKFSLLSLGLSLFLVPVGFSQVTFSFDYSGAPHFDDTSKASLASAADLLAAYFEGYTATIEIAVTSESDAESSTLASAGSNFPEDGEPGFGNRGFVGAEILTGVDGNGAEADGTVDVNFGIDWAFGDSVGAEQFDFKSTMIHELFHAVGFNLSLDFDGSDPFGTPSGSADGLWAPFDQFIGDSAGTLINPTTYALDTSRWDAARTGGTGETGLLFLGDNAMAANGGNPVPLYSPLDWEEGSSGSHLDDDFFTSLILLMEAATDEGLGARTFSAIEIGILKDIGFALVPGPGAVAITGPPLDTEGVAGEQLTLSVTATASDAISYQWLVDDQEIEGATQATHEIPILQRFDAGVYTVRVTAGVDSVVSTAAEVSVSNPPPNDGRLLNLSTRGLVQTGDNVLIPGFVISGMENKQLLIRAVGPTLVDFGVQGALSDPILTLRQRVDGSEVTVAANDNWGTNANSGEIITVAEEVGAFSLGSNSVDAALLLDLPSGQYTAVAGGVDDVTGIAIVELYDSDGAGTSSRLVNISNRGFAGEGDAVMIPGFVISPEGPKTLLLRVVGPTLGDFGVASTMADPMLTLFRAEPDGSSTELFSQDDWEDNPDAPYTASAADQVGAFPLAAGSADAAFVVTLTPGSYTAAGSSADGSGGGIILVEAYIVEP